MVKPLMDNILKPSNEIVKVGSPFAMLYMYETLEKYGLQDEILKSIYESYLPMLEAGATTVWESFASGTLAHGQFPTRSHCHAWSSSPLYFFSRIILGIKQTSAGCESFEISPCITGLDWAKGSFATPHGPVEVNWSRNRDEFNIRVSAPSNVEVLFKENDTISGLKVELDIASPFLQKDDQNSILSC